MLSDNTMENEKEKNVAFYNNLMSGWISTKLEKDKSILTLSAGGIGLLVSLLNSNDSITWTTYILYIIALSCFLVSIIYLIFIFDHNADHIMDILHKRQSKHNLERMDKIVFYSFVSGVCIALLIGVVSGKSKLSGGNKMSQKVNVSKNDLTDLKKAIESLYGLDGFEVKKSSDNSSGAQINVKTDNSNSVHGQVSRDINKK
jgi:hypothetical protein